MGAYDCGRAPDGRGPPNAPGSVEDLGVRRPARHDRVLSALGELISGRHPLPQDVIRQTPVVAILSGWRREGRAALRLGPTFLRASGPTQQRCQLSTVARGL